MGNPSSGSIVQTTMSLSKGRHRQSPSVASLQLEKLAQQERFISTEKQSGGNLSPRATEDKSIAALLGDKITKRRTRSSLGGTEDFMKGLELNGVALLTEERKPSSLIPFRGHRRVGSGNVTPSKSSVSPRAKGTNTPPGKDKYAVAKIAASLFYSPTKLERSMSLSRVAHRAIPEADGTPRRRAPIAVGEVILPFDKVVESKQQESQMGLQSKSQAAATQTSEGDAGKEKSSVLLATDIEGGMVSREQHDPFPSTQTGASGSSISMAGLQYTNGNGEYLQNGITAEPKPASSVSSPIQGQLCLDAPELSAAPLTLALPKDGVHVCLDSRKELHTEKATSSALDVDYSGSSFSSVTLKLSSSPCGTSSHSTLQDANSPHAYSTGQDLVLLTPDPSSPGPEISHVIGQGQPSARFETSTIILPPSEKLSALDPFHLDPEELVLPSAPQVPSPMKVALNEEKQASKDAQPRPFSPEKVTEAELTEAAFLSSLVCEDNPVGPVLISAESKQFPLSSFEGRDIIVRLGMDTEIGANAAGKPDACLMKGISFEPGLGDTSKNEHEKRTKLRKRRRSVSASGIGAMLLKVVRVSDSGPVSTRKLPKVGPEVSGVDQMRAREYVIQKTAQITMGQPESPTPALHQGAVESKVKTTNTEAVDMELDSGDDRTELVRPDTDGLHVLDDICVTSTTDAVCQSGEVGRQALVPSEPVESDTQAEESRKSTEKCQAESPVDGLLQRENTEGFPAVNSSPICTENSPRGVLESFPKAGEQQEDSDLPKKESSSTNREEVEAALHVEKVKDQGITAPPSAKASVSAMGHRDGQSGGSRRRQGSKGRISYDFDHPTEWQSKKLEATDSNSGLGQAQTISDASKPALSLLDENVAIPREKTRSFASMLQVSPRQSLDEYRLAPSSISILANPSFSSSHQDRLWEEQAEAYSSGGRGTPGREDDAAANVFLHSPSPGGAVSSDDQVPSASGSLRRGQTDSSMGSASGLTDDKGRSNDRKKGQGKKRGRPRTPLRSLLAEDTHSKGSNSGSGNRSPESGHFLQQIMSRIRGSSSKSLSPKSPEAMPKRRHTLWSSCICFSHVK